ncbi:MAG TPA: polysaccharide biosynthesis/export family protein [Bacillota bacterium]|nr:polysaccharide biosynthesis/export family protein [Bacillota bacterium]
MKRALKILVLTVGILLSFSTMVLADDLYRLGFGDSLTLTFWSDGYEGLQQCELPVRPDGKVALAFSITQLDDYHLGPGDTLNINVWGISDLNSSITVRSDGKIAFPLIGELTVDGMTPAELAKELTEKLRIYIKEPVVTVNIAKPRRLPVMEVLQATGLTVDELTQSIKTALVKYIKNPQLTLVFSKYRTVRVYVLGEATTPGTYEITKSHNVLDAIGAAGGYTRDANKRQVYVVRKSTGEYIHVDLKRLLKKGDLSQNYELGEGDTVYIARNGMSFVKDILPLLTGLYQVHEMTTN